MTLNKLATSIIIGFLLLLAIKQLLRRIEAAINSDDIFNEKQYDYLLRNGCALIYVHCNVSLFKEYAFQYRDSLKRLIQQ